MKSLDDLFMHFLRDILYAEKQALKAMKGMQRKASSDELKSLIEAHRQETEGQIDTLEKVFEMFDKAARGVRCEAIDGIIEEAKELMEEAEDDATRDAAIIAAAQAVEHYEITRYGTLVTWAKSLGHTDAAALLSQTLEQEMSADQKLSTLATSGVNEKAMAA
ncbi:ferritin-like domain-containing protein [Acuticoccus kandeliae]|uniref:YciE/YciF ferroxidase family protein n=1 Tax=Acuticoccus kandeliae TaxID=2073160 RepID=UPI000D3E593B